MSRIVLIIAVLAIATTIWVPQASAGNGGGETHNYSWFRDADGDGIPNCLDEDWVRPLDGSGYQLGQRFGFLPGALFFGTSDDGKMIQNKYRQRKNRPEMPGNGTGDQKRLRDGSCD